MKTYRARNVPDSSAQLLAFLRGEFSSIQEAANRADPFSELQTLHKAPVRLRNGIVALADGSDWNPGSGAGLYLYLGGSWLYLGTSAGSLQAIASDIQRLVFLGQEQLRQLTKIVLILSAISGISLEDDEVQAQGLQVTQLTKIAEILAVIGGVSITDDEIQLPT